VISFCLIDFRWIEMPRALVEVNEHDKRCPRRSLRRGGVNAPFRAPANVFPLSNHRVYGLALSGRGRNKVIR